MSVNSSDLHEYFRRHVTSMLSEVQNQAGALIDLALLEPHLLPVYFSNKQQPGHDRLMIQRREGYMAFSVSLTTYILTTYPTVGTRCQERLQLQAMSATPLSKLAGKLQLQDTHFDCDLDSTDRLVIIVGILFAHYGTPAVDSFLHPLFTQHIFKLKKVLQSDPVTEIGQFAQNVMTRDGSLHYAYEAVPCTGDNLQWECTLTYQLSRNAPYFIHQRSAHSKKVAKQRVIKDVINYYRNNDATLLLHCKQTQNQADGDSKKPEVLFIPAEKLYQYDNGEIDSQATAQSLGKRKHCFHVTNSMLTDKDDQGVISFLAQVLLCDFSKLNFNEEQESSPTSSLQISEAPAIHSPASASTSPVLALAQPQGGLSYAPRAAEVPESKIIIKDEQDANMTWEPSCNKKRRPSLPDSQLIPSCTLSFVTPEEHRQPIASKLLSTLPPKDLNRLIRVGVTLMDSPNNVKGVLLNLATKFNNGHYLVDIVPENNAVISAASKFKATVRFGTPESELVLAESSARKLDAECLAGMQIFKVLESVLKKAS